MMKEFETNEKNKDGTTMKKPKIIINHNNMMRGVNRLDQQLHDYLVMREQGKKYYKKIFFHLLNICAFNAFVPYIKNQGKLDHLEFSLVLIVKLFGEFHSSNVRKPGGPKNPVPLRLSETLS